MTKEVMRYFSRLDMDDGKIMEYNLDGGKTHLLVFKSLSALIPNFDPKIDCVEQEFDVEVEYSDVSTPEDIEQTTQATLNRGTVSALIVITDGNESPVDTEALLNLMCDKTLSGKPKVLWIVCNS